MARKDTTTTPRSKVKAALHSLWLRSRERASAIKRDGYTCKCGKKQSKAAGREISVEVHHLNGVEWEQLIDLVYEKLLQRPEDYLTLCRDCHKDEHGSQDKTCIASGS